MKFIIRVRRGRVRVGGREVAVTIGVAATAEVTATAQRTEGREGCVAVEMGFES